MIFYRKTWCGIETYFWDVEYVPVPATSECGSSGNIWDELALAS